MLTYRTGAAGAPSAAKAMGEHLLQQTLPPDMAVMAEYYAQGTQPPTPAEAAAARYAAELATGDPEALDRVVSREVDRLADLAPTGARADKDALRLRALGAFVAAELIDRDAAIGAFHRAGGTDDPGTAIDRETATALTSRDYSSATATPRRDMNPALAARLGIETTRGLTPGEVANLLNGQRADGAPIAGKQRRGATEAIGALLGLDEQRLPTATELGHILAGRKADGAALLQGEAERVKRRFHAVLGAKHAILTDSQREHILAGRTATGAVLTPRQYHERMDTSRARIGYVDLTFSAPKSVSIAWAFAPTEAERGMIHQAHRDAIESVMGEIERQMGRARKGKDGRDGWEEGSIGWVSFDHYTSRPTVPLVREDRDGVAYTELHTVRGPIARVAGDMQLHTHTAVFNAVLTESGRMGGLWLDQLEGRVKEWGALYHAFLATNLRRQGVEIGLDTRTELSRLHAVPESVVEHFSKRTVSGSAAAREYAAQQGLDWDSLDADRKVGLLKQAVQDPRGAKSDDLSDAQAWARAAAEIGYRHRSILRPDAAAPDLGRAERIEAAYRAALPIFDKTLQRRATVEGADARAAAAKGLIASGIGSAREVDDVTRAFRERGVTQHGAPTALTWGQVQGKNGRERVGITTALHEREERALIERARTAAADKTAALAPAEIAAAVARFPDLDYAGGHGQAQRTVMEQLGTGGRLGVAIGVAGSGKTTLLKPLVAAWQEAGREVHGIALAWRQSSDLVDAGIAAAHTRAVENFLRAVAKSRITLDETSVVVVDELGLLGTRQLNTLLQAQQTHGFQIVALGDPKQMQSVEAGAVITLLRQALGEEAIPTLATSVRQVDAQERETVLLFRNGEAAEAVRRKAENGTLLAVPGGYGEAVTAVVRLWEERRAANAGREGYSVTISAPTNHDAHQISLALRERRRELGEVGANRMTIRATDGDTQAPRTYDMALAEGDRVRLFQRTNARFLDGGHGNIANNGTVLTVAAIRKDGLVLRTKEGRDGLVQWDTLRHPGNGRTRLAYGDVLTINTTQGATVSEHILAIPAGSKQVNAFGAYTAASRHRERGYIVTSDGAERADIAGHRPLGDKRQVRSTEVTENIAKNFARQPEKETALGFIERAAQLRKGGVRAMQAGKLGLEQRQVEGKRRATLSSAFRRHGDERRLKAVSQTVASTTTQQRDLTNRLRTTTAAVRHAAREAVESIRCFRETVAPRQRVSRRRSARL
jgi:hypothetical protein